MASSPPEIVTLEGKEYRPIREGLASVLAPYHQEKPSTARKGHNNDEGTQAVFYNPIQQFNRDLSVLAILVYGEGAILEKAEKSARRVEDAKKRKQNKKQRASGAGSTQHPQHTGNHEKSSLTSTKRKANEIDEGTHEEAGKRIRTEDFDADEEEIEIMQLNSEANESRKGDEAPVIPNPTSKEANTWSHSKKTHFSILDALSATGLRALRYAKEIPFATHIVANDVSREAVKSIELNIAHNGVAQIVHSNVDDARAYMHSKVGNERPSSHSYIHRFDAVDLDPYGTAAPFLDAAIQCLQDGGLLCVTCTDAGVFASNGYPEKAYALYSGIPCKAPWSHEAGLRLILNSIAITAAKYGIAIEPLLSLSIDFYARIFVRIHKSPTDVKMLAGTTMMVYNCDAGCGAWSTQPVARNQPKEDKNGGIFYKHGFMQAPSTDSHCEHCGSKTHLGGPMWAGPIHNPYFVQKMLDRLPSLDTKVYGTVERLTGMLTVALEEDLTLASSNIPANTSATVSDIPPTDTNLIPRMPPMAIDTTPFFFIPGFLAKVIHCSTPAENLLRGAIRSMGYLVTRSHCKPGSFKTNAPWSAIWEVMREWARQKAPIKEGAVSEGSPGWKILQRTRDTRVHLACEIADEVKHGLQNFKRKTDLEILLRSAIYRLENERVRSTGKDGPEHPSEVAETGSGSIVKQLQVQFDENLGREKARGKLVRYQINPRANWGPMNRAMGGA